MLYLGLGTNIGNRLNNIEKAYELISKHIGIIREKSSVWESKPWGFVSSNNFYNSVCAVEPYTEIIDDVMTELMNIERKMGRIRIKSANYEDRIIDIDILAYADMVFNNKNLIIPHPKLHQRLFVLIPFKEVAPTWKHPLLKLSIDELMKKCLDKSEVVYVNY